MTGLEHATFVVIGAGGLGCPALLGLSAQGARRVIVVDDDRVEVSNLQRQVLYAVGDVGARKVDAARHRLQRRCPALQVQTRAVRLQPADAEGFVRELPSDAVVLECTDSPQLKFAVNDAALDHGVPAVIGASLGWSAQALAVERGHACYRCIYESPPRDPPTCATAGVLGSAVGTAGFVMASLAVGLALGRAETSGRLIAIDLRTMAVQQLQPALRAGCTACARRHAAPDSPAGSRRGPPPESDERSSRTQRSH
jgi:adenylyltransferase/sulfurtransferase